MSILYYYLCARVLSYNIYARHDNMFRLDDGSGGGFLAIGVKRGIDAYIL